VKEAANWACIPARILLVRVDAMNRIAFNIRTHLPSMREEDELSAAMEQRGALLRPVGSKGGR
jgi:hypothetical protein